MIREKKVIGILGTGQLAEFIITGIHKVNAPYNFILSPRSYDRTLKLKNLFDLEIAESNQDLLDTVSYTHLTLPTILLV